MRRGTTLLLGLVLAGCARGTPATAPSPTGDPSLWRSESREPYPFVTPIPPRTETPVDGVYRRNYRRGTEPIPCRRCAPYRLDRGQATLELRAGRFFVSHEGTLFRSEGHFLVDGSRVVLFNDPVCPETRGVYRWARTGGVLTLELLEDPCPFDLLRARYLTAAPWRV